MDLGIKRKTAFVAGGSKGMGRSVALLLAAEGCRVAVVARGQEAIDEVVAEIQRAGGEAIGISADLVTEDGVNRAVEATRAAFGDPEIVISQTNSLDKSTFWDAEPEQLENTFRVFTMGAFYLARATVPAMRKNKWGRFVHLASATAKEPETKFPHLLANVVRPSTIGLLKTLADDVAADNVTINTVAPGWILTPSLREHFKKRGMTLEQGREWLLQEEHVPAQRWGTTEEIAGVIVFYCSESAGYMTGNWTVVDGGMHRSLF